MLPVLIASFLLTAAANADDSNQRYSYTSKGCGKPLPCEVEKGISKDCTIDSKSGASPRTYRIHVPESYKGTEPVPLIFSFHGRTQTPEYQEQLSQFSNSSYGFEGISVYPQGVPSDKGSLQWQGDPDSHGINDVKFTMELLDELLDNYCIDPSRVYAAGKSNGGGFTGLLACDATATKRIAAFAPVSGAFYLDPATNELPPCKPSRAVIPIMEFHGWKDNTIDYVGGPNDRGNGNTVSIFKWVEDWAKRDGFDIKDHETTYLCSGARNVTRYSWSDTVVHYNVSNLFHDWPSTFPNGDTKLTTCQDVEATSVILKWFAKWTLPADAHARG